jgi:plastocyanin
MSDRSRFALFAVLSVLAACGGGDTLYGVPSGDPPAAAATVQATPAKTFTPPTVTISAGGTVTFEFGTLQHNVYFDASPAGAPANIAEPMTNATVTRTFTTAGRYTYTCHVHPSMTGVVVVE